MWESLDSVQGDTVFVDHQFNTVSSGGEAAGARGQDQDRDHQLAVSLQKQDAEAVSQDREWAEFKQRHLGAGQEEAGSLNKCFEVSKAGMPVEMGTLAACQSCTKESFNEIISGKNHRLCQKERSYTISPGANITSTPNGCKEIRKKNSRHIQMCSCSFKEEKEKSNNIQYRGLC